MTLNGLNATGTITVSASAVDSGGNTSSVASIVLDVVDTAPHLVTIDAPAPQTGYNDGDTVTIEISATDAAGVTQIRHATTGALSFSGSRDITAFGGSGSWTAGGQAGSVYLSGY